MLRILEALNVRATRTLAVVAFVGLLTLALATVADILGRWLFGAPLHGVGDIAAVALAAIVAASVPANLASERNVNVDLLGSTLGGRAKAVLDSFGALVTFGFITVMAWQFLGYAREIQASGQKTWVLGLSLAPWWWAAALFLALCVPVQLVVVLRRLARLGSATRRTGPCAAGLAAPADPAANGSP